jgi:hypothetical protein
MKTCASREAYGKAFGARVQSVLISTLNGMIKPDQEDDEEEGDGGGSTGQDKKKKFMGMF